MRMATGEDVEQCYTGAAQLEVEAQWDQPERTCHDGQWPVVRVRNRDLNWSPGSDPAYKASPGPER